MQIGIDVRTCLIGMDWGTTKVRAFRIGHAAALLEQRESALGIAAIADGQFDPALRKLVADWQPVQNKIPILMCGMIGSRQGWREVPYRPCPASLGDLAGGLALIETGCGPAHIVGGLLTIDGRGDHDVMRGEETQILGMPAASRQIVVAPGTHSKWAVVDNDRIESFRTYMTGEIYDLLRRHSTLGWVMQAAGDAPDTGSFTEGVRRALDDQDLLNLLFAVRTKGLFGHKPPAALASYLSGLLIGTELASALRHHTRLPITVIASPGLGRLYALALRVADCCDAASLQADKATATGLWKLWQFHTEATGQ